MTFCVESIQHHCSQRILLVCFGHTVFCSSRDCSAQDCKDGCWRESCKFPRVLWFWLHTEKWHFSHFSCVVLKKSNSFKTYIFIFVRIFLLAMVKAIVMFSYVLSNYTYIYNWKKRKTIGSLSHVNIFECSYYIVHVNVHMVDLLHSAFLSAYPL